MRRCAVILFMLSVVPVSMRSAEQMEHRLPQVNVTARRPMKDIGVQKTVIDSAALKENIALSMADVLTFNSSVFVKSYGRATLSTVTFRGTSPGHTQVTWNGMKINNPMLGMTDFSTIPSYFIDNASLLHGTSSINETGGGLGGLVSLGTTPSAPEGFRVQYVQGVGSFKTFDEFLRLSYANEHLTVVTRAVYSSSPNDYKYVNHDKVVNVYDEDRNIIGRHHPVERNQSGSYKDFHLLQEIYYDTNRGDRFGVNAWYINSNRELPLLTTEYGAPSAFENRQREHTFRGIFSWGHTGNGFSADARAGYIHTWLAYDYKRDVGGAGGMAAMTRARSRVNTVYGQASGAWRSRDSKLLVNASFQAHQHFVRSEDKNIITTAGNRAIVGYNKARIELSGSASVKWQPIDRVGVSAVVREDMYGDRFTPVIPAFFVDGVLSRKGNVMAKASISRNYRFPSLNDMYFLPGGNPRLRSEQGFTYDCSMSFSVGKAGLYALSGNVGWFDSYINDWIIWLPTVKGFFSPRNVKKVHAYGVEASGALSVQLHRDWLLDLNGSLSWTPSINCGAPLTDADRSVGKQLPYVPRLSSSVTGRLSWRRWSFLYKWAYYAERYTMSSNETTLSGTLPPYFMSNVALGYGLPTRHVDFDFKLAVNNIFNEDYLSVLAHPMPGINFEFFVSITPHW